MRLRIDVLCLTLLCTSASQFFFRVNATCTTELNCFTRIWNTEEAGRGREKNKERRLLWRRFEKDGCGKRRRERRGLGKREESMQNSLLHDPHAGLPACLFDSSSCHRRGYLRSLNRALHLHLLRVLLLVPSRATVSTPPLWISRSSPSSGLAAICKSLLCLVWSLLAFSFSMFDLFVVMCTTLCTSFLELV